MATGDDSLDTHFEIQARRQARAGSQVYVDLQPGETAIAHMASRIYAARIVAGSVNSGEEDAAMRTCVREALRLAHYVEHAVDDAAEGKSRP